MQSGNVHVVKQDNVCPGLQGVAHLVQRPRLYLNQTVVFLKNEFPIRFLWFKKLGVSFYREIVQGLLVLLVV